METVQDSHRLEANKSFTTVIYAMYAFSIISGVTFFVGIVMNYMKREAVAGTFLESHFRWQIRTFWFSMLWTVLSFVTIPILIGFAGFFFVFIWFIYRIAKGWMQLNENQPMYAA